MRRMDKKIQKYAYKISENTDYSPEKAEEKIKEKLENFSSEKDGEKIQWLSVKGATKMIFEEEDVDTEALERIRLKSLVKGKSGKVFARIVKKYDEKQIQAKGKTQKIQDIIVGDKTDSFKITLWNEDIDNYDLEKGDIVKINNARFSMGKIKYKNIEKVEKDDLNIAKVENIPKIQNYKIEDMKNNEKLFGKLTLKILKVKERDYYHYSSCDNCKKKRINKEGKCKNCGEDAKIVTRLFLPLKVTDGEKKEEITLWTEDLKELTGLENITKVAKVDKDTFYKKMKENLEGNIIEIKGSYSNENLMIKELSFKKKKD